MTNSLIRVILFTGLFVFLFSCITTKTSLEKFTLYVNYTRLLKANSIPDSIFEMNNLKTLIIEGMDCPLVYNNDGNLVPTDEVDCWRLIAIDPNIRQLKGLERLSLPLNAITKIPEELGALKNLKVLDLTENPLTDIKNIGLASSIEELYLFSCGLRNLPLERSDLPNLKILGLSGNLFDRYEKERIIKEFKNCRVIF